MIRYAFIIGTFYFYTIPVFSQTHIIKELKNKLQLAILTYDSAASLCREMTYSYAREQAYTKAITMAKQEVLFLHKTQDITLHKTRIAEANFNLASLYRTSSNHSNSIYHIKQAISIYKEEVDSTHLDLIDSYKFLAQSYYLNEKYSKALTLAKKTLPLYHKQASNQAKNKIDLHLLIGNIYTVQSQYDLAEQYYSSAQNTYNKFQQHLSINIQARIYNDLATLKVTQEAILEALAYYQEIVVIRTRLFHESHASLQKTYLNMGNCYYKLKKYHKAIAYQKRSLLSNKNNTPDILSAIYNDICNTYKAINKKDSAFTFMSKAILQYNRFEKKQDTKFYLKVNSTLLNYQYYNTDINSLKQISLKNINSTIPYKEQSKIHLNLAYIHRDIKQHNKAIQYAIQAYHANINKNQVIDNPLMLKIIELHLELIRNTSVTEMEQHYWLIDKSTDIINNILIKLSFNTDKYLLIEKYRKICTHGIAICNQLYKHTHNEQYLSKAFELSEYNKAVLLSIQMEQLYTHTQQQDSNYHKKQQLLSQINLLESEWKKAQDSNDNTAITTLQIKLFKLNKQYQDQFGKTTVLRQRHHPIPVKDIQKKLNDDTAVLSYFYGEKQLYTFVITNSTIKLEIQPLSFEKKIDSLVTMIAILGDSKHDFRTACYKFDTSAYALYQKIIPSIKQSNLLIIPDGKLNYLPFEALTTSITIPQHTYGYHQLKYLLYQKVISYAYSVTSYYYQQFKHKNKTNASILGFAPFYDNHHLLPRLKANIEEVAFLQKTFKGQFYYKENATKKNYIEQADKFSIIHLATHGYADNYRVQQPQLFFTDNTKDSSQSILFAHEIIQQSLKSDFIILSACQTGIGYWQKGEGIMSLARNFAYAGTPSLLTTLWQINDASSNLLIQDFYTKLPYKNKAIALQQAKNDYIQNASAFRAHPYFWAGYILVGNTKALNIDSSTSTNLWYIAPLLFSFLSILAFFFRKSQITKHS